MSEVFVQYPCPLRRQKKKKSEIQTLFRRRLPLIIQFTFGKKHYMNGKGILFSILRYDVFSVPRYGFVL